MIFTKIMDFLFPPKCVLCGKIIEDKNSLCTDCWKKIYFIKKPYCDKCSSPFEFQISSNDLCLSCIKSKPLFIKSRSAVIYNEYAAKIIFRFKFYDKIELRTFLAKSMINAAFDIIDNIDIFIPIPLHKKRLIMRKYNQSLILAETIAKITGKKLINDFLCKKKHTTPQAKLKQKDRIKNLKNIFAVKDKYSNNINEYKNLNFAIVDDVMTTGSTINECIKELNGAGIKNVYAITFAKTKLS